MRRHVILSTFVLLFALCCAEPCPIQGATQAQKDRLRQYRHKTVGPKALARTGAGAAVGQFRNSPKEWGRGPGGFAKRFASGLGQHATGGAIQMGVGALRHEDPRYDTRHYNGVGPKLKAAAKNTFLTRRKGHSKQSVSAGKISGAMGGGMVSRLWQPDRLRTVGSGLETGGISLGADFAANTAREFWPEHKPKTKPHPRRRSATVRRAH